MNKLDAMRVLSGAYNHLMSIPKDGDLESIGIIVAKFHEVRRSLQSIEDLRPKATTIEGLNGRMPTHF